MKFVYCGYDFMLGVARRLVADGHTLCGILTFPCDNIFNFNTETIALAEKHKVPISLEKPSPAQIAALRNAGTEIFIAAGYLYKIPDVSPAYGLNIHPSLLPKGRGIMPLPFILLDHPEASGLTIHKLSGKFDTGDILLQEKLPLSETETVETLSARMAARAPDMISAIIKDLPGHWNNAVPQDETEALHFPPPGDRMRILDWDLPIERLDKIARAFGRFGSLAPLEDGMRVVYAHAVEKKKHTLPPGKIAVRDEKEIAVAANGGIFILKKFEKTG